MLRYPSRRADANAILLGKLLLARQENAPPSAPLMQVELSVFSQWGQDGILHHLLRHVPVERRIFVEFGVEDYREANTRFLLVNGGWKGLVIDGDPLNIELIRDERISVYHELVSTCAFVTAENINSLIRDAGYSGDIGILSVDVDGMDYWIWRAIEVVSPRIVVCEYNSLFGATEAVTVPYDPGFSYGNAHFSRLYFGASLAALCRLAAEKGYVFVGSTSAGNDAFFVRADVAGKLPRLTPEQGYVDCDFRDSRGPNGEKTFLSGGARLGVMSHLPLLDLTSGRTVTVGSLLKQGN